MQFNLTCDNINLPSIPVYTYMMVHNARVRGDKHVLKFRKELLKQEINRQIIELVELEPKLSNDNEVETKKLKNLL